MASRHRQVLAISGRSIPEWKALARQLNAKFHHRWRSAMSYLDPAASGALSYADDVMVTTRCGEEVAIVLAQEAYQELQQMVHADPSLAQIRDTDLETPYLDDWY